MARRRWQQGSIVERKVGNSTMFDFRLREDVVLPSGEITRTLKRYVLGPKSELKTKRLAMRHPLVVDKLRELNSLSYAPKPVCVFEEFADKWKESVVPQHKLSTQSSMRSQLKAVLIPAFGKLLLKDLTTGILQQQLAAWTYSPKTKRNLIGTLSLMWNTAKAWGFVSREPDPFEGLVLPDPNAQAYEQPCFTSEQMQKILAAAKEPYKTLFWLVAETGVRRGEACALQAGDVDLETQIIVVRRNNWNGHLSSPKSKKPRVFSISAALTAQLRKFVQDVPADTPIFTNRKGKPLNPDNLVKRHLKPILTKLGLKGAMHAFRHGNASLLDSKIKAPMKVRQDRLGHVDSKTTMGYTHSVGADDRNAAEQLGQILNPN